MSVRAAETRLRTRPYRCTAPSTCALRICAEASCYAAYLDSTPGNVGDANDVYTVRMAQSCPTLSGSSEFGECARMWQLNVASSAAAG